jgi:hypothetical protein
MEKLSGFKTVAIGAAMVALPPIAQYIGGIDWTQVVPASMVWAAPMISGAVMLGLRFFTRTAIFQKAQSVDPTDPRLGGLQ